MKHSISNSLLVFTVLAILAANLSCTPEPETSIRDEARERLAKQSVHTDHSGFFHEPFADGPAVTRPAWSVTRIRHRKS